MTSIYKTEFIIKA